jgi:hypothetical protein
MIKSIGRSPNYASHISPWISFLFPPILRCCPKVKFKAKASRRPKVAGYVQRCLGRVANSFKRSGVSTVSYEVWTFQPRHPMSLTAAHPLFGIRLCLHSRPGFWRSFCIRAVSVSYWSSYCPPRRVLRDLVIEDFVSCKVLWDNVLLPVLARAPHSTHAAFAS